MLLVQVGTGLPHGWGALWLYSLLTRPDSMAPVPLQAEGLVTGLDSIPVAILHSRSHHHLLGTVCSPLLRDHQTREQTTQPTSASSPDTSLDSHPNLHPLPLLAWKSVLPNKGSLILEHVLICPLGARNTKNTKGWLHSLRGVREISL